MLGDMLKISGGNHFCLHLNHQDATFLIAYNKFQPQNNLQSFEFFFGLKLGLGGTAPQPPSPPPPVSFTVPKFQTN